MRVPPARYQVRDLLAFAALFILRLYRWSYKSCPRPPFVKRGCQWTLSGHKTLGWGTVVDLFTDGSLRAAGGTEISSRRFCAGTIEEDDDDDDDERFFVDVGEDDDHDDDDDEEYEDGDFFGATPLVQATMMRHFIGRMGDMTFDPY